MRRTTESGYTVFTPSSTADDHSHRQPRWGHQYEQKHSQPRMLPRISLVPGQEQQQYSVPRPLFDTFPPPPPPSSAGAQSGYFVSPTPPAPSPQQTSILSKEAMDFLNTVVPVSPAPVVPSSASTASLAPFAAPQDPRLRPSPPSHPGGTMPTGFYQADPKVQQMMAKQGWTTGMGLGRDSQGSGKSVAQQLEERGEMNRGTQGLGFGSGQGLGDFGSGETVGSEGPFKLRVPYIRTRKWKILSETVLEVNGGVEASLKILLKHMNETYTTNRAKSYMDPPTVIPGSRHIPGWNRAHVVGWNEQPLWDSDLAKLVENPFPPATEIKAEEAYDPEAAGYADFNTETTAKHDPSSTLVDLKLYQRLCQFKNKFAAIDEWRFNQARNSANPWEYTKETDDLFVNRCGLKALNIDYMTNRGLTTSHLDDDALCDGHRHGVSLVADMCAAPGGMSAFLLAELGWRARIFAISKKYKRSVHDPRVPRFAMRQEDVEDGLGSWYHYEKRSTYVLADDEKQEREEQKKQEREKQARRTDAPRQQKSEKKLPKLETFKNISPTETFSTFFGSFGADMGDVTEARILKEWTEHVVKKTPNEQGVDLFVADGGFGVKGKENEQEFFSEKMILAECIAALKIVKEDGNALIKWFDTTTPFSASLLWIMLHGFAEMHFLKPEESRPANSECYIWFAKHVAPTPDFANLVELLFQYFSTPKNFGMIALTHRGDRDEFSIPLLSLLPYSQVGVNFTSKLLAINEARIKIQIGYCCAIFKLSWLRNVPPIDRMVYEFFDNDGKVVATHTSLEIADTLRELWGDGRPLAKRLAKYIEPATASSLTPLKLARKKARDEQGPTRGGPRERMLFDSDEIQHAGHELCTRFHDEFTDIWVWTKWTRDGPAPEATYWQLFNRAWQHVDKRIIPTRALGKAFTRPEFINVARPLLQKLMDKSRDFMGIFVLPYTPEDFKNASKSPFSCKPVPAVLVSLCKYQVLFVLRAYSDASKPEWQILETRSRYGIDDAHDRPEPGFMIIREFHHRPAPTDEDPIPPIKVQRIEDKMDDLWRIPKSTIFAGIYMCDDRRDSRFYPLDVAHLPGEELRLPGKEVDWQAALDAETKGFPDEDDEGEEAKSKEVGTDVSLGKEEKEKQTEQAKKNKGFQGEKRFLSYPQRYTMLEEFAQTTTEPMLQFREQLTQEQFNTLNVETSSICVIVSDKGWCTMNVTFQS